MSAGWKGTFACAAGAAALALALHLAFGDVDLNLADEGFLWYGVLRTLEGLVPLRDFQSYEPGRYWWCAAWCACFGPGLLVLRGALAAFQALGLFCGLSVLRRLGARPWAWLCGGAVLALWMFPRHKVFEPSIALLMVLVAVRLAEAPTLRRHFASGLVVGLAGLIGRNHVLYGTLGFLLWMALLSLRLAPGPLLRRVGAFAAGGFVGMLPLLAMLAFVPGYGRAFLDSVLFFREHGSNIPLAYPWPWRFGHESLAAWERVSLAAAFLLPLAVYGAGLVCLFKSRSDGPRGVQLASGARVLLAATCIGVFYAHHASVRSDDAHLAQGLQPALLGALALPFAFGWRSAARVAAWSVLGLGSWLAASAANPALQPLRPGARPALVPCEVAGERLRLAPEIARQVQLLEHVVASQVPVDEELFLAPGLTTFYPVLDRVSPVWGIYFLWQANEAEQQELVRQLEERGLRWALIKEAPPDGRVELLFRNTHPLVWRWLARVFERVPTPELPENYFLLRRRER